MCFKSNEVCVSVRKPGVSGVLILMRFVSRVRKPGVSGVLILMRCAPGACAWMRCIRCGDSNEV